MRNTRRLLTLTFCVALVASGGARTQDPIDRITEADLKADLFALAGDAMRGREGGTLDEMTASVWVAERAREAGLLPAATTARTSSSSRSSDSACRRAARHAGRQDAAHGPRRRDRRHGARQRRRAGRPRRRERARRRRHERQALVVRYEPAPPAPTAGQPTQSAPNAPPALRNWARAIQRTVTPQNPAAIVALVPDESKDQWDRVAITFPRGTYGLDPDGTADQRVAPRGVPLLYVKESALGGPLAADATLVASIFTDSFHYPSVNVIAKVPGRDPALANEYVLFSAHQDHDGERYPVNGDDIWNGADDNATTAVALLAIGRAVSASPRRRSALFIWHGAEERGLMGSRWYVKHPTVPLASIVACLNGDMIGRNDPDTAALLGALPPHRNSPELVDIALAANKAVSHFAVDSSWDDPNHREGWYYRSDHLPYARTGVPALFFTTLLHPDYHTPFDNPDRIDVAKLTKMTRWMYATGRSVGEADKAPAVDPAFKLERCRDFTGNYCGG